MATKIEVMCACGGIDVIPLAVDVSSVEVSVCVLAGNPCALCGGALTAPAGRYEKHPDGTLYRVGDISLTI